MNTSSVGLLVLVKRHRNSLGIVSGDAREAPIGEVDQTLNFLIVDT